MYDNALPIQNQPVIPGAGQEQTTLRPTPPFSEVPSAPPCAEVPSPMPFAKVPPTPQETVYCHPAHEKEARFAAFRIGCGILTFSLLPSLLASAAVAVLGAVAPDILNSAYTPWVLQVVLMYGICLPLSLWIIGRPKTPCKAPGEKLPLWKLLCLFCMFETGAIVGSLLSRLGDLLLGLLTGREITDTFSDTIHATPLWIILVVVCVIGPIVEELLFRRAVIDRLLPYGEKSALLVSALLFGLVHENFGQLYYTFAGGIVLAYVYIRTRNSVYNCALHIAFNFLGSFVPVAILQLPGGEENLFNLLLMVLYAFVEYGLAVAGLVLLIVFFKRPVFRPAERPLATGHSLSVYLGNVGIFCLMLYEIYALFSSLVLSVA